MKTLKSINVSKVAAAIEADAGQALPGLRESLAEAKAGKVGKVHPRADCSEEARTSCWQRGRSDQGAREVALGCRCGGSVA